MDHTIVHFEIPADQPERMHRSVHRIRPDRPDQRPQVLGRPHPLQLRARVFQPRRLASTVVPSNS